MNFVGKISREKHAVVSLFSFLLGGALAHSNSSAGYPFELSDSPILWDGPTLEGSNS